MASNACKEGRFDFDEWSELARRDPEAFDSRRRAAIEDAVSRSRDKRRLVGLQWRIDMECQRSRTPFKSCLRISDMMWKSFHELNVVLQDFLGAAAMRRRKVHLAVVEGKAIDLQKTISSAEKEDAQ